MIKYFKVNIGKFRKTAEIASAVFILAIALLIIFNTTNFYDKFNLSFSNRALKHLIKDHKINNTNFCFIKINFDHKNYFEKKSDIEFTIAAAISLFLVSYSVIFIDFPGRKNFYAEIFLFIDGFNISLFRPPENFS